MAVPYKIARGVRANFETLKSGNNLIAYQPYFITDENVLAIATSTSTAVEYSVGGALGTSGQIPYMNPAGTGFMYGGLSYTETSGKFSTAAIQISGPYTDLAVGDFAGAVGFKSTTSSEIYFNDERIVVESMIPPIGADGTIPYVSAGNWASDTKFTYGGAGSLYLDSCNIQGSTGVSDRSLILRCSSPLNNITAYVGFFATNSSSAFITFSLGAQQLQLDSTGALTWNYNTIWHAGNDGAASGLDADLLDGQHGSYYTNVGNANAGTLAVARGGTGQTTLALARNAMGLGNTTGALPIANGGTGQTTAPNARTALGLGTAATYDVPPSGNASASQVVLGNDTRLGGGSAGSNTQVIYNSSGTLTGNANMTFDGTTFEALQARARLVSAAQNGTVTISSTTYPSANMIIKKTVTTSYTYTINNTFGNIDDTVTFIHASTSGNLTIQGSGVTIYRSGTAVSSIVLTARQMVTLVKIASNQWIC